MKSSYADKTYDYADEQIAASKKLAAIMFHNVRLAFFDELNVIKTYDMSKKMYKTMDTDNKRRFIQVAKKAYKDAWNEAILYISAKEKKPKYPDKDWLTVLLLGFCFTTKYVYEHEVERKASRFAEALLSDRTGGRVANSDQYKQAMRYWNNQTEQYYINVVDEAKKDGYKDAGVKKVEWVTMGDDRVCPICNERDGHVYDIDKIPEKPHMKCRCTIRPIDKGGDDDGQEER